MVCYYDDEELNLEGLHIETHDEYQDMDYYRSKGEKSDYNYVKRRYESNYNKSGTYISLYKDNYSVKLGYYYISSILSVKPISNYPAFTNYCELLEFGFINNDVEDVKFLINNMLDFASECNSKFLKVKTKEKSFKKFYDLLRTYPHKEDKTHIYLKVINKKLQKHRYLKHYKSDKLSIRELYHLYAARFNILKDKCVLELPDNKEIVVYRKSRKVKYPENFKYISEKYKTFNQYSMDLISFYKMSAYEYKDKIVDTNFRIEGYDYDFIKIGRELHAYKDFKYEKDDYKIKEYFVDFAMKASEELGLNVLHICSEATLKLKTLYATCSKEWNYLPSVIEKYRNPKPKSSGPFGKFFATLEETEDEEV